MSLKNIKQNSGLQIKYVCLAEQCKQEIYLTNYDDIGMHKHSKTDIKSIEEIKSKLEEAWEPKQCSIQPYFEKVNVFYQNLRKQILKLIDEDQKTVQAYLIKIKYHHLPYEANSQAYLQLKRQEFEKLDKSSIMHLLSQAQNGELNKNLQKQKQILNFMDVELTKVKDKVATLKYVLLSKKLQSQLLSPNLTEISKVASTDEFIKIYSFFNSRNLLIRLGKLIYRGSENEFSSQSFYNCCNDIHNCMAIVKTKNGKLVGGFTPLPLVHHDEDNLQQEGVYEQDKTHKSFIFNITNLKSYSLKDHKKAILYKKGEEGPSFGSDLVVRKQVTSNIGHSYECDNNIAIDSLQAKIHLLEAQTVQARQFQIWQLSF